MNTNDYVEWLIRADKPGSFSVIAETASPGDAECEFVMGGESFKYAVAKTGSHDKFAAKKLGVLAIPGEGKLSLQIKPVKAKWSPVNVRAVTLRPE